MVHQGDHFKERRLLSLNSADRFGFAKRFLAARQPLTFLALMRCDRFESSQVSLFALLLLAFLFTQSLHGSRQGMSEHPRPMSWWLARPVIAKSSLRRLLNLPFHRANDLNSCYFSVSRTALKFIAP